MSPDDFRKLVLRLPEVVEQQHQEHPDFRIGKKVFATLGWPDSAWAMIKLPLEEQQKYIAPKRPVRSISETGLKHAPSSFSSYLATETEFYFPPATLPCFGEHVRHGETPAQIPGARSRSAESKPETLAHQNAPSRNRTYNP
jgi:hypothetical protein